MEEADEKCEHLLTTYNQQLRNKYDRYYYGFLGCEALNLIVVCSQASTLMAKPGHQAKLIRSRVTPWPSMLLFDSVVPAD